MVKDESTIEEKYPLFQWTPPIPLPPMVRPVYYFRLCEMKPGQILQDAIDNPPHFEKKGISTTSLRYPASAKPLEPGKSYCWQVQATDRETGKPIGKNEGKSEIRTFIFQHVVKLKISHFELVDIVVSKEMSKMESLIREKLKKVQPTGDFSFLVEPIGNSDTARLSLKDADAYISSVDIPVIRKDQIESFRKTDLKVSSENILKSEGSINLKSGEFSLRATFSAPIQEDLGYKPTVVDISETGSINLNTHTFYVKGDFDVRTGPLRGTRGTFKKNGDEEEGYSFTVHVSYEDGSPVPYANVNAYAKRDNLKDKASVSRRADNSGNAGLALSNWIDPSGRAAGSVKKSEIYSLMIVAKKDDDSRDRTFSQPLPQNDIYSIELPNPPPQKHGGVNFFSDKLHFKIGITRSDGSSYQGVRVRGRLTYVDPQASGITYVILSNVETTGNDGVAALMFGGLPNREHIVQLLELTEIVPPDESHVKTDYRFWTPRQIIETLGYEYDSSAKKLGLLTFNTTCMLHKYDQCDIKLVLFHGVTDNHGAMHIHDDEIQVGARSPTSAGWLGRLMRQRMAESGWNAFVYASDFANGGKRSARNWAAEIGGYLVNTVIPSIDPDMPIAVIGHSLGGKSSAYLLSRASGGVPSVNWDQYWAGPEELYQEALDKTKINRDLSYEIQENDLKRINSKAKILFTLNSPFNGVPSAPNNLDICRLNWGKESCLDFGFEYANAGVYRNVALNRLVVSFVSGKSCAKCGLFSWIVWPCTNNDGLVPSDLGHAFTQNLQKWVGDVKTEWYGNHCHGEYREREVFSPLSYKIRDYIVNYLLCGEVFDGKGGPLTCVNPYLIICDVIVPQGKILTIQPDARIYFEPKCKMKSEGMLNANGEVHKPIHLLSEEGYHGMKLYRQLRLQNGGEFKL